MATLSEWMGIGAVTPSAATYRARATGAGTVQLEYSTDSGLSGSTTTTGVSVVSGDDFTGGEEVTGLSTNTTYFYSVKVDGVRGHSSPFPSFKTFPTTGVDANVTIVVGSCASNGGEADLWPAILAEAPDLILYLGDFGYPDTTALASQRSNYQTQYGSNFQTSCVNKMARAHVWDDHDYGPNNSHGDESGKAESLQAFSEYVPHYPLVNGSNGIWQLVQIGNIDIFMLDVRYQREGVKERFPASSTKVADTGSSGSSLVLRAADSPSAVDDAYNTWYAKVTVSATTYYRRVVDYTASTRTCALSATIPGLNSSSTYVLRRASMLDMDGIANSQIDWLIDELNASTARWKVLATASSWNASGTAATLATDTWGAWDTDRVERGFILQECADVENLIVCSGDYHGSGIDDGTNADWPEISASPFNQGSNPIRGTWTQGTNASGHSYGVMEFTAEDVTLTVRDADGTTKSGITPLVVDDTMGGGGPPPGGGEGGIPWLRTT